MGKSIMERIVLEVDNRTAKKWKYFPTATKANYQDPQSCFGIAG